MEETNNENKEIKENNKNGNTKNPYELKTWDPLGYDFSKPFTMICSASRNSGKSYFVKALYQRYLHIHFDSVIVFSHSVCNGFYEEFIPGKLMFNKFSDAVLRKTIKTCQEQTTKNKNYRVLIIMDDCLTRKAPYSQSLNDVFSMGRHVGISCVFITQTLKTYLSGLMKENTNLLVILHQRSRKEKEYLIENFLDDIIDDDDVSSNYKFNKRAWCLQLLKKTCTNYHAMVIELETNSNYYKNIIYKYKA